MTRVNCPFSEILILFWRENIKVIFTCNIAPTSDQWTGMNDISISLSGQVKNDSTKPPCERLPGMVTMLWQCYINSKETWLPGPCVACVCEPVRATEGYTATFSTIVATALSDPNNCSNTFTRSTGRSSWLPHLLNADRAEIPKNYQLTAGGIFPWYL